MSRASYEILVGLPVVCLTLIVAGASAQGGNAEARKLKSPVKATAESIAAGGPVFRKYCAFCHGTDAKGNGPLAPKGTNPPDLTDSTWLYGGTDGEIFTSIRDGVGPKFDMKPLKEQLSDEDIWNVVTYLRSIGPKSPKK